MLINFTVKKQTIRSGSGKKFYNKINEITFKFLRCLLTKMYAFEFATLCPASPIDSLIDSFHCAARWSNQAFVIYFTIKT